MMSDYDQIIAAPRTSGKAIAALVFGIGGIVIWPVSIAAIIFGHVARREVRQSGEAGDRMATAGLVLGYVGLVIGILLTLMMILLVNALDSWS